MVVAKGKILAWGNSFGLRLSRSELTEAGLSPGEEVEVEVKKRFTTGRDVFGTLKNDVDTAKALREIDETFGEK